MNCFFPRRTSFASSLLKENMASKIRRMISSGLLICAIGASSAGYVQTAKQPVQSQCVQSSPQVAYRMMEVRIRRLHLVRPDLIPYPIAYEVIC
jgi:hypothetical protein